MLQTKKGNTQSFSSWSSRGSQHFRLFPGHLHLKSQAFILCLHSSVFNSYNALFWTSQQRCRSWLQKQPSKAFLEKVVLKIYSKFTGEQPCWSVISIKLRSNFIEITLWHRCSLVNLLHIFRTTFLKNLSGRQLL